MLVRALPFAPARPALRKSTLLSAATFLLWRDSPLRKDSTRQVSMKPCPNLHRLGSLVLQQNLYTNLSKDAGSFLMQQGCLSLQTRGLKAAPKQMEVILTADINKVGKAGEIVKVAKGYARNMLIPQLLALPKLDKYVNVVRKQLRAIKLKHPEEDTVEEVTEAKTEEQRLKELNIVLNRMDTQRVVVRRHTPRRSTVLLKHITPEDIIAEVKRQQKIQIEEINLEMSSFLTTLGEYEIPIRLPREVQIPGGKAKVFLKVKVRRA